MRRKIYKDIVDIKTRLKAKNKNNLIEMILNYLSTPPPGSLNGTVEREFVRRLFSVRRQKVTGVLALCTNRPVHK